MAKVAAPAWRRVIVEKPFGRDQQTAKELNEVINSVFPEKSVFRIDHYLGKETVQNIMALRFANQLFDPLWNSHYIDHVQITMAEDIGLGGRAGYYDGIGAARGCDSESFDSVVGRWWLWRSRLILRRRSCRRRR